MWIRLEIWPGYVTAAHYMESGVMLVVDTSHRVLRTTTAHEIMLVTLLVTALSDRMCLLA